MATIRKTIDIAATADTVWQKVADTGRISDLIGFLAASEQNGDTRVCTLEDGATLTEQIISVDPDLKRVMYAITDSPLGMSFHAASMEVSEHGGQARLTWTVDLLPAAVAEHFEPMLDGACADMKAALAA